MNDPQLQNAAAICRQTIERGGAVLLLPGVLSVQSAGVASADTSHICRLLQHAQKLDHHTADAGAVGIESLIMASLCADQTETCAASVGYAFEFGAAAEGVMRADPAYQQIDMNNATLTNPDALNLQADEAQALLLTLNEHFVDDGLRFEYKHPQRWYCHFKTPLKVATTPLSAAIDHDVAECRPYGDDARAWRSKLAEIEMLLFDHAVNHNREMQGQLPVNTLWLWGEGQCDCKPSQPVKIVGDNHYAHSLSQHLNLAYCSTDDVQQADKINSPTVIALEQLTRVAVTISADAYRQTLHAIDVTVGKHLWSNYQSGNLSEILIWCGGDDYFQLQSASLSWLKRKLDALKKPKPLSDYVQQSGVVE